MKKLRKTNGITLIALIITILILLIIAGVVIGTINGGILGNANKSAEKYNNEAKKEEELLGTLGNKLKDYTGETPSTPDQPTKEPTPVEYFNWTTTETEATITGFSEEGKAKYNAGEITELVIPSEYNGLSVTTIRNAFKNCTGLTEVYIPKGIVDGVDAFEYCKNITKVTFEDGMTKIPNYIMEDCTGLKEIIIPDSVTMIGECAFKNCTGLTEITIPNSVTTIRNAFKNCTGLTEVYIPKGIVDGVDAFEYCKNITKVTFEDGMTKIPNYIMEDCTGLKEIIIPDSVTMIGECAFYNCTNLTTINFRGTQAQWNAISIGNNNTPLTSATINYNQ